MRWVALDHGARDRTADRPSRPGDAPAGRPADPRYTMLTGHSSTDPPIEREQVVPRDATDPQARLTFPDLPRLELDELLTQLVNRAHEVQATQGRLRGLLHANQLINADLALPAVL